MSNVVETSFIRFFRIRFSDFVNNLHSLRSVEMTVSINMYIGSKKNVIICSIYGTECV